MKDEVSVIIPFLNESENIHFLTHALDSFFEKNNNLQPEVIFVDDGSEDNSVELLKKYTPQYFTSKIIKLSKNYGSHAALRAGILHAQGKYITFMYADLQDPLELVNQLHMLCKQGNEIVWAVRASTASNFFEKSFSQFYAFMMKKFAIRTFPEKGFDVVMFTGKVQKILNENIEANSSIFLQILTLGFRQSTITYHKQSRKAGKSKWTINKKIKIFIDSFVSFSFAPIRLVTLIGFAMFLLGLLWTLYIIGRKLLFNDLEPGWPALVSILMIGFGITNISLGIIAEYLWRTLDASRKRPVFIVDEILEAPVQYKLRNEISK
ncbi:glycosyltransferase [Rhodocytophaga rosea]|uniref:Glycosyltransferase n=1 Tax=Rhodocytophaga rosea TaxID=2704465 RepID=A0A6C0GLL8_9BACT|nr:glycosyltransferase [Rhodocytophaga rosea]QHT68837.1 glycosyltransferase [Rhodocytophaga rosea]